MATLPTVPAILPRTTRGSRLGGLIRGPLMYHRDCAIVGQLQKIHKQQLSRLSVAWTDWYISAVHWFQDFTLVFPAKPAVVETCGLSVPTVHVTGADKDGMPSGAGARPLSIGTKRMFGSNGRSGGVSGTVSGSWTHPSHPGSGKMAFGSHTVLSSNLAPPEDGALTRAAVWIAGDSDASPSVMYTGCAPCTTPGDVASPHSSTPAAPADLASE